MGLNIPRNGKLTAGNILCAIAIGLIVLLMTAAYYLPESIRTSLNYLGIVAFGALCVGAPLRREGLQEHRADIRIALQQKLKQGLAPDLDVGIEFTGPANAAPAQYETPGFQATASGGGNANAGMVFCHACGKPNDGHNTFCNNCGAEL